MEFDEFKIMIRREAPASDSREEIATAFAAFSGKNDDGNTKEFITVQDLCSVAASINETCEPSKYQEILNCAPGTGYGTDEEGNSTGLTIIQWREIMEQVNHTKFDSLGK